MEKRGMKGRGDGGMGGQKDRKGPFLPVPSEPVSSRAPPRPMEPVPLCLECPRDSRWGGSGPLFPRCLPSLAVPTSHVALPGKLQRNHPGCQKSRTEPASPPPLWLFPRAGPPPPPPTPRAAPPPRQLWAPGRSGITLPIVANCSQKRSWDMVMAGSLGGGGSSCLMTAGAQPGRPSALSLRPPGCICMLV